jgi:hypothetical protein
LLERLEKSREWCESLKIGVRLARRRRGSYSLLVVKRQGMSWDDL